MGTSVCRANDRRVTSHFHCFVSCRAAAVGRAAMSCGSVSASTAGRHSSFSLQMAAAVVRSHFCRCRFRRREWGPSPYSPAEYSCFLAHGSFAAPASVPSTATTPTLTQFSPNSRPSPSASLGIYRYSAPRKTSPMPVKINRLFSRGIIVALSRRQISARLLLTASVCRLMPFGEFAIFHTIRLSRVLFFITQLSPTILSLCANTSHELALVTSLPPSFVSPLLFITPLQQLRVTRGLADSVHRQIITEFQSCSQYQLMHAQPIDSWTECSANETQKYNKASDCCYYCRYTVTSAPAK